VRQRHIQSVGSSKEIYGKAQNEAPGPEDSAGLETQTNRRDRPGHPLVTEERPEPPVVKASDEKFSPGSAWLKNRGFAQETLDRHEGMPGSATTIKSADFNRDGRPDLAVPHRDGGQSLIYLNDGKGVDGFLDIATARSEARNMLYFGTAGNAGPRSQSR
jgi:hypothetical protein